MWGACQSTMEMKGVLINNFINMFQKYDQQCFKAQRQVLLWVTSH